MVKERMIESCTESIGVACASGLDVAPAGLESVLFLSDLKHRPFRHQYSMRMIAIFPVICTTAAIFTQPPLIPAGTVPHGALHLVGRFFLTISNSLAYTINRRLSIGLSAFGGLVDVGM